ncbi:terminase large subunit [Falsirhodobacter halotolerans]|uniref:terminase large subunit n=1 Tax=Falsirhodobacter halotolerans TaxID=1146892 RepID=UPI001FD254CA|nr:terminase TerL endonuclease subunit [Falsirhodobacter halotolerans]MCJ8139364.1 phage terminase family protein [Falsirhodobacter halotolerans]
MHPIDHPVSRYALDVIEGRIIAGDLVTKACLRHLTDLETGRDRGLYFDVQAATRITRFAKMICHTTGPMAGKPLALEPWQVFRHGSVFGWKREATGLRRFKSTYHQVAKKNGKTTDTAVPMLFTQLFDGEAAPQGYCAATTREQAGLLFNEIKRMIRASPALSAMMRPWRAQIDTPPTSGYIKSLSRDGGTSDGINPHFAARDEVHRWTDRELAEVVTNSMIARAQPIDWAITTAGADRNTICGELREYTERVVNGAVQDDSFFGYVAEPPQDADPADPVAWKMGNPNLGVAFTEESFREILTGAQAIQGRMPNFRRLHLNLWTEGEQTWIGRDSWDRGDAEFDVRMLYGKRAWAALDMSRTTDMTSIVVAVPHEGQIYLITYSFLPAGEKGFIARAQRENRDYVAWRDAGWLEVHNGKGGSMEFDKLIKRLELIRSKFDLQELAFDRWGMRDMRRELERRKFPLVEHGQGAVSMSSPMKTFEQLVIETRIRHSGNPVLAWAVGNVMVDMDKAENISPNKKKSKGRIDPAVAAIMAVGRAVAGERKRRAREIEVL